VFSAKVRYHIFWVVNMSRYEVIKHSAVIQMTNRMPVLPRRLWNVLLANAYDKLPTRDLFTIPFPVVQQYLDFKSHNYEYIRDALRLLVETSVEFNVLGKDKRNAWGTSSLLSSALLYHSTIEYSYSPHLRRLLYEPSMYARIPLLLPNQFKSKHTLLLYELCLDYFDEERRAGETPAMPIETFKELFDVPNYAWEDISKRIIKVAITELTALTPLRVEMRLKRYGRKITDIKFLIRYAEPVIEALTGSIMDEVQHPKRPRGRATVQSSQGMRQGVIQSAPVQQGTLFTTPAHNLSGNAAIPEITAPAAPSLLYTPRDYDALFATLSFEEQHTMMQRAEAALPTLLRDYVQHNPRTYERIAKPTVIDNRNALLEEYLREQEFTSASTATSASVYVATRNTIGDDECA
jgi:Initiator Replication protein